MEVRRDPRRNVLRNIKQEPQFGSLGPQRKKRGQHEEKESELCVSHSAGK